MTHTEKDSVCNVWFLLVYYVNNLRRLGKCWEYLGCREDLERLGKIWKDLGRFGKTKECVV